MSRLVVGDANKKCYYYVLRLLVSMVAMCMMVVQLPVSYCT